MEWIKKFKKWLFRNKKRKYKIRFIATGFMGNKYDAGIYEIEVSDADLKFGRFNTASEYGFSKNFKTLKKHFPSNNDYYKFTSATTELN